MASGPLVEHKRLPEWAQRGAMRSCVCPFDHGWLRAWLDTDPLACHFTVLFTDQTAWEDPRTPTRQIMDTYVRPRNGHLFFYTCPNSIYYDDHFEREDWNDNMAFSRYRWDNFHRQPYAKDCINYNKDGQPTIAYLLPSMRHRTSYFATQWAEHEKQIMDYMVKGKAAVTNEHLRKYMHELKHPGIMDGFYFDNAGMRIDWSPLAMERWKRVSQERFGKVVDPKSPTRHSYGDGATSDELAVRMAWLDTQYRSYFEFHGAFWKHGWTYNRPRLTLLGAHGAYGYYESETDFPDIEFYENTYRVQPESDNIWELKCGLARTHGKAQACLNHERWRPEKLSPDGSFAVLNWFLTREFGRLSMAECMAMNGNHMLQIGPLTYNHMRYGADYRLYNGFNRQLQPEIYRNAQPAARLAVFWSPASEGRGSTDNEPLGRRLWMMGFPYEVVVEHDLKPKIWPAMAMDALVLSDIRCLNEPRVALVLDWVRKGGRCLVAQSLGERDEMGLRQNSASARALLGDVGGRIRYDADTDFQLEMFEPERGGGRSWIPQILKDPPATPREGNATVAFTGPTGVYDLRLEYLDEDDGRSPIILYRNQDVVAKFVLDQQNNKRLIKLLPNVKLSTGDRLRIHAVQDADEFCRIFSLEAVPAGADVETVTYREVGQGRVAFAPEPLMDYQPAEFEAVLQKLTDGKLERCTYPRKDGEQGAVFCNLMRDFQQRGLQVILVNATYATPERYAPLCSTAALCRADLSLAKVPKDPVVRVLCWGRGKGWQLVAKVNDTDLEPVDAAKIQDTIWVDIPVKPELLKEGANRVTLRLTGKPNAWGDHAAIYIDTGKSAPQSAFSADGGKSFSADDLSTLTAAQRGAFMLEITSSRPLPPRPPEMRVRLVPRENLELRVRESSVPANASALVISPDLPPERVAIQREKGLAVLRVPKLQVYSVAVLSADAAYLSAIELKARVIKYDPLPPRTPEFRTLLRAGAVGEKLQRTDLEGDFRLRGVTAIDPSKVTGRTDSHSIGVELARGRDFVIEPDGRLYRPPDGKAPGGRIFLTWTDIEGGHYRERYEPYAALGDGQLLPPYWNVLAPAKTKVFRETERPNVHSGDASVRIVAAPDGGIYTSSFATDPGRPYRLSVWLKVAKGEAQVVVTGGAKVAPARCSARQWTEASLNFVAEGDRVDIGILLTADGLKAFHERFVGRGYVLAFAGAHKSFRDAETGVRIEVVTTGEYPGDGKPKPVSFPDPSRVSVEREGIRVLTLEKLVELKLVSGQSAPTASATRPTFRTSSRPRV